MKKDFFKLVNNAVFGKTVENVRKSLAIKKKETEIPMNKLAHLRLSIQELSKTLMYVFCFDYVKPKYDNKNFLAIVI